MSLTTFEIRGLLNKVLLVYAAVQFVKTGMAITVALREANKIMEEARDQYG